MTTLAKILYKIHAELREKKNQNLTRQNTDELWDNLQPYRQEIMPEQDMWYGSQYQLPTSMFIYFGAFGTKIRI